MREDLIQRFCKDEKPWLSLGMSRSTWYQWVKDGRPQRKPRKQKVEPVATPKPLWRWLNSKGMRVGASLTLGDPPTGRSALEGYTAPWCPKWQRETCARHVARQRVEPSPPRSLGFRIGAWNLDESSLSPTAMAVLLLGRRQCKFPIGGPGQPDFHFCSARRVPGREYCAAHLALSWVRK